MLAGKSMDDSTKTGKELVAEGRATQGRKGKLKRVRRDLTELKKGDKL